MIRTNSGISSFISWKFKNLT